jgi:hypothetical protein
MCDSDEKDEKITIKYIGNYHSSREGKEFSLKTKRTLYTKTSGHCSNPDCRCYTMCYSKDLKSEILTIGQACHIYGASEQGPRHKDNMEDTDYQSYDNGIWLCSNCHKMVDSDSNYYTDVLLKQWKNETEEFIRNLVVKPIEGYKEIIKSTNKLNQQFDLNNASEMQILIILYGLHDGNSRECIDFYDEENIEKFISFYGNNRILRKKLPSISLNNSFKYRVLRYELSSNNLSSFVEVDDKGAYIYGDDIIKDLFDNDLDRVNDFVDAFLKE